MPDTKWMTDAAGARLGVQVCQVDGATALKLLLPDHGREMMIDREGAQQLFAMLQNGITFSKMLGDNTFNLLLDELPAEDREGDQE